MKQVGTDAGRLFLLLNSEHPRDWKRIAPGILSLTKAYPKEVVNLSLSQGLSI